MANVKRAYSDPLAHAHDDEPVSPRVSPWLVFAMLLLAAFILAVLNSQALVNYLDGQEPNALTEWASPIAYGWHELMDGLGLTRVSEAVRDFVMSLHDA